MAVDNMQVRVSLPPNPPPKSNIHISIHIFLYSYIIPSLLTRVNTLCAGMPKAAAANICTTHPMT